MNLLNKLIAATFIFWGSSCVQVQPTKIFPPSVSPPAGQGVYHPERRVVFIDPKISDDLCAISRQRLNEADRDVLYDCGLQPAAPEVCQQSIEEFALAR